MPKRTSGEGLHGGGGGSLNAQATGARHTSDKHTQSQREAGNEPTLALRS